MNVHGFQKILVATDFSDESVDALAAGGWLARAAGAELVAVHVLPSVRRAMESMTPEARWELVAGDIDVFEEELRRESNEQLAKWLAKHCDSEIKSESESLVGIPFVSIIHEVQKRGYDLVITGTRGVTGLKRWLVGSTALRIIHNCPSTVWIVRRGSSPIPKAILVPTDFSEPSRQALEHAHWLAGAANAALHVLHVVDSGDSSLLGRWRQRPDSESANLDLSSESLRENAEKKLAGFVTSCCVGGVAPTLHVAFGSPWVEIGMAVRRLEVDLIAMGTTGRSGIGGLLLGNTAERVLDTVDCSLLAFKPEGFVSPVTPSVLA